MSNESPSVVLYDLNGNALAVQNSTAIPASTPAILLAGSDGTNSHYILMDGYGRQVVVGAGTAGSAIGGVLTVQGIAGGITLPISGVVTANQGSPNIVANSWPVEMTDGTNILGTPTHPVRVDTTGTTTQPVTGTGSAGTSATGVVTIQGIAGGTTVPISGTITVNKSTTGTFTSVPASTSSISLLASNSSRIGAAIYNDSSNMLYIGLSATTTSTTAFTIKVLPNSYFDLPVDYTGQINGIWNGTNGNARLTEWT